MTKQHKNLIDFAEKSFSEKLAIIEERNKTYGSNFDVQGNVMSAIFPNGLELKTESDWKRIGVFMNIIGKITRYANTFSEGGHKDSLVDTCNYCTILEFLDKNCEVERDVEEVLVKGECPPLELTNKNINCLIPDIPSKLSQKEWEKHSNDCIDKLLKHLSNNKKEK